MRLTHKCPYCNKTQETDSQEYLSSLSKYLIKSKCGHSYFVDKISTESEDYLSVNGKLQCYPFQIEGIKKAIDTNFNILFADAMGLGKTIQGLVSLRNAKSKLTPAIIVVKTNTIPQWMRETWIWFDYQPSAIYPIIGSKSIIPPNFPLYLISMDTLSRNGMWKKFLLLHPKAIIVDECHSFKDPSAKRTQALVNLIKEANIEHKLLMSGTPIKNRANEYYTALNLLAPQHFRNFAHFQRTWLVPNEGGIYTRVKPWRLEEFKELISQWVIRREKEEVLLDLPPLAENYNWERIESDVLKSIYNDTVDRFDLALSMGEASDSLSLLGWLTKLRRITAEAKVPQAADYVEQWLDSNENAKIAIGVHHHSVRDGLKFALESRGIKALTYSGEDNPFTKDKILQSFEHELQNRVLIISELAGGYGLNLQFCADVLILERQWNYADEEQFVSRFHRNGQTRAVTANFMLCENTVDQYFHDMVLEKKSIFGETIGSWDLTSDPSSLKELAHRVTATRLQ